VRVVEVRSYPVKSMDAVAAPGAEVGPDGLAGDRTWTVVDSEGKVLTARQAPALREVQAAPGARGPQLRIPGGPGPVEGRDADAALSTFIGTAAQVRPAEGSAQQVAPIHLVSRQAVAESIGTTSDDPACDIAAPRANITVDLGDDPPAGLERSWVGQEVLLGSAVLRVTQVPQHCLGVYAEVVRPGTVNLGDAVEPRG
jgi:hypothetical protein